MLWLVVHGAMDLFAVDAVRRGRWHFLGRLPAGTLLLGPVTGPQHTLVGRPMEGCVLHRIELRELFGPGRGTAGVRRPVGVRRAAGGRRPVGDPGAGPGNSPLEDAFALGIGRGLGVLYDAPVDGRPVPGAEPGEDPGAEYGAMEPGDGASASSDEGILWMPVPPGSVQYGERRRVRPAGPGPTCSSTATCGSAWSTSRPGCCSRSTAGSSGWSGRTRTGPRPGSRPARRCPRAGRRRPAGLHRRTGSGPGRGRPAPAVPPGRRRRHARRVPPGRRGGRDHPPGDRGARPGARPDHPVERIAVASRLRTREIALTGRWWREDSGPLVGHRAASGAPVALLWRRGGYEAVTPATGRRARIGRAEAAEFAPRAVMFYRPLPEEPLSAWGLVRFSLRGNGADLRGLVLSRPGRGRPRHPGAGRHRPGPGRLRAERREQPDRPDVAGAGGHHDRVRRVHADAEHRDPAGGGADRGHACSPPSGTGCCACRRSSSPSAPPANWPARPWASARSAGCCPASARWPCRRARSAR